VQKKLVSQGSIWHHVAGTTRLTRTRNGAHHPHGPHLRIETVGTSHPQTSRKIAPGAEFGWFRTLSNLICPIKKLARNEGYGHHQFSYRWFYSHPRSVAPEAHIEASWNIPVAC
jgi:hypothetical protein